MRKTLYINFWLPHVHLCTNTVMNLTHRLHIHAQFLRSVVVSSFKSFIIKTIEKLNFLNIFITWKFHVVYFDHIHRLTLPDPQFSPHTNFMSSVFVLFNNLTSPVCAVHTLLGVGHPPECADFPGATPLKRKLTLPLQPPSAVLLSPQLGVGASEAFPTPC